MKYKVYRPEVKKENFHSLRSFSGGWIPEIRPVGVYTLLFRNT
jgi:hypothetical protein